MKKSKIISTIAPEILSVPIVDCTESLVDLKDYNDILYGTPPECELTANCYTKVRKTIFEKLCIAQKALPKGARFRLYEGFRSLEVQKFLFDQELEKAFKANPSSSYETWFNQAARLAAPVINLDGTANIPPHNTGGAIDIEVIDKDGTILDMGMVVKDWSNVDPEICVTASNLISKKAGMNRKMLLEILENQGFVNYPNEWWHFSYGDRYWAYHQGQPSAIYGSIEINDKF
jgi:D-alanyl-D-alanine dipeptidase